VKAACNEIRQIVSEDATGHGEIAPEFVQIGVITQKSLQVVGGLIKTVPMIFNIM
jgi:hypothetical protein